MSADRPDQLSLELRTGTPRLPPGLKPMLPLPLDAAFDDPGWLFDAWWDGLRVLAYVEGGQVRIIDARGRDLTSRFPEVAGLAASVDGAPAILDGELVAVGRDGRPDHAALRQRLLGKRRDRGAGDPFEFGREPVAVTLLVSDLLYQRGAPLLGEPLHRRRRHLASVVHSAGRIVALPPVPGDGTALHVACTEQGLAGIVAKRRDGPYLAGHRSELWRSIRAAHRFDAVVAGFDPQGGGALLLALGAYRPSRSSPPDELVEIAVAPVAGRIAAPLGLRALLERRSAPFSPFARGTRAGYRWVRPELAVTIEHRGWNEQRRLIEPRFVAIRDDVDPQTCRLPEPQSTPAADNEPPRRPLLALFQRLPLGEP